MIKKKVGKYHKGGLRNFRRGGNRNNLQVRRIGGVRMSRENLIYGMKDAQDVDDEKQKRTKQKIFPDG